MKIALFDIDGTLLATRESGKRSMGRAMLALLGTEGPREHRYDGKTDKQIVREALQLRGFSDADISKHMDAVIARYLVELEADLSCPDQGAIVLPGVHALLEAVDDDKSMVLGLLTGNVEQGATRKLRAAGIEPNQFLVHAFGSDHEVRHELPRIARAATLLGRAVSAEACVIIGDTPNDVACSRPIGARAIAVATGHYSVADLQACSPEAVFADLTDTCAVLEAIRAA